MSFIRFGKVGHPHPSRNVYDRKVILMDESFGTSNGTQQQVVSVSAVTILRLAGS